MILSNIKPIFLKKIAIIYITKQAKSIGIKLQTIFPNSKLFSLKQNSKIFEECFKEFDAIVSIMATGIVVRKIAPMLKSKVSDPAVVVIDENGKYVISLLSGHIGRANELSTYIADKFKITPVITTATDVQNKFAIDTIPSKTGWVIENIKKIKEINMAILNNEKIGINISEDFTASILGVNSLKYFKFFKREKNLIKSNLKFKVVVSNRNKFSGDFLLIRPKNLYIGLGCNRGTSFEEIENVILDSLNKLDKSVKSINSISSFELKSNEEGLLEFGKKYNIELKFYTKEELNSVKENYKISNYLIKNLGVKGVCEPAAILSATKDLCKCLKKKTLLQKQKIGNVTIAIQELLFS